MTGYEPRPEVASMSFSVVWEGDNRVDPPLLGGEREMLTRFLDWHRDTIELKCAGVPPERLAERSMPPSTMSLHGLLRHLAGVERWWFRIQFTGEQVPMLYYSDDDPDQDFDFAGADPLEDLAAWRAEVARSREIVDAAESMEVTGTKFRTGAPFSLRHLLVSMIAEYARHSGHADLLREGIDGAVGH